MKKLEEKIIGKIYKFETKKTTASFFLKTIIFIVLFFFVFIIGQAVYELCQESYSFDFFQIFSEDLEVMGKYLFENMAIFFDEIPKFVLIILFLLVFLLIWLSLTVAKKFGIIKNKISSLINFWFAKK